MSTANNLNVEKISKVLPMMEAVFLESGYGYLSHPVMIGRCSFEFD